MPTINELRAVDPILGEFALEYSQENVNAAADLFFPRKGVAGETGTFYVRDANDHFRDYEDLRADGAEANAIKHRYLKDTFSLDEYALKEDVTDRQRANALSPLTLDQDATGNVVDSLALRREIRARNIILPDGFTPEDTTANAWDGASATVMLDNEVNKQNFHLLNGKMPNIMFIPMHLWTAFLDDTTSAKAIGGVIHDKLKYTQQTLATNITPQMVANLFGIDRVVILDMLFADAQMTTTKRGGAGIESGTYVWGTDAVGAAHTSIIYAYLNPGAGLKALTLGWGFSSQDLTMFRYREEKLRKDWVEGSRVEQFKIVAASCLYRYDTLI